MEGLVGLGGKSEPGTCCKSGGSVKFGLTGVAVDLQAPVLGYVTIARRRVAPYKSTLIGTTGTVGIVSAHPSRD
ncbi:unnamed protein product [Heligmosomoides polygyrus]|uniref:FAD-binding PCMH-type domain-containing protein n=1 Tax=Heligmosomoides polygyrus TaxID=6339 RepID=A0A183G3S1_HELPZ|nr:unnamed protein product [Heligmosomoides polygyrus]